MSILVCYPKCTTCIKSIRFLEENNFSVQQRDIKLQNPTVDELKKWHAMSNLPLKRFFNTSGLIYRDMGLKDKLPTMSEEQQYQLLASDGMLVKRPILVLDEVVLVGFKEKEWSDYVEKK